MASSLDDMSLVLQSALTEVAYEQLVAFVGPDATREKATAALELWRLSKAVDVVTAANVLSRFWPASAARYVVAPVVQP